MGQNRGKIIDKSRLSGSSIRGDHLNVPTGIGKNIGRDGFKSDINTSDI